MSTTFDKVNLIMLEEVTGCRVIERTEARTGKESHESEGEGQGREALRKELRRGRRRLSGAEGCVGRDLGIAPLL